MDQHQTKQYTLYLAKDNMHPKKKGLLHVKTIIEILMAMILCRGNKILLPE